MRFGGCVSVCVVVCVVVVVCGVGLSSCADSSSFVDDGLYVSGWKFPHLNKGQKLVGEGRGDDVIRTVDVLSSEVVGGSMGDEDLLMLMSDEEMEKYKRQVDIVTE